VVSCCVGVVDVDARESEWVMLVGAGGATGVGDKKPCVRGCNRY
jgi:hypothetical protein